VDFFVNLWSMVIFMSEAFHVNCNAFQSSCNGMLPDIWVDFVLQSEIDEKMLWMPGFGLMSL
jgi:hypothetical protein